MNRNFSRAITALRKEKQISQKQAAKELGISQALLSHYEKGVRECSLDFVCKIADYYDVSADFLLGRSPERHLHSGESQDPGRFTQPGVTPSGRLLSNTMNVIYQTLGKIGSRRLTRNVSELLMLTEYRILRALYPDSDAPGALFSADTKRYRGYASSAIIKLFSEIEVQREEIASSNGDHPLQTLTPDLFIDKYPEDAASVMNVISHAENTINKIK